MTEQARARRLARIRHRVQIRDRSPDDWADIPTARTLDAGSRYDLESARRGAANIGANWVARARGIDRPSSGLPRRR